MIRAIDAESLQMMPLKPIRYVVEDLIPEGLTILGGAPKIGKSWLALWICLQVASGQPVWNFQTMQGTVLYMCLEDSLSRVQQRLFQLTQDAPSSLMLTQEYYYIDEGLPEQIIEFVSNHPDTKMVVIDTLHKIRQGDSRNLYAKDYDDLSALKVAADTCNIALVLITHVRKMQDPDPINMLTGTTGISGASDTNLVLTKDKRTGRRATLFCTGRDILDRTMYLEFNKDTHLWELLEDESDGNPMESDDLRRLKGFLLELKQFEGSATELNALYAEHTGDHIQPNILAKRLVGYTPELNEADILLSQTRTSDSRKWYICYAPANDRNDGNDGSVEATP